MKKILIIASLLAQPALANKDDVSNESGVQTVQICNQAQVKECKAKVIYMTYKQEARIKALQVQIKKLQIENAKLRSIEVIDYDDDDIEVKPDTSAISLIVPVSPTKISVTEDSNGDYKAETEYEVGIGLLFQHDFYDEDDIDEGAYRVSVGADTLGTFELGLGLTW